MDAEEDNRSLAGQSNTTTQGQMWARHLYQTLCEQLNDVKNPATEELFPCGEQYLHTLRTNISSAETSSLLDETIRAAHEQMTEAYSASRPNLCWRRLYTDACILKSLLEFSAIRDPSEGHATVVECISRLDKAIIIAGPAGEGRHELTLDIISRMQSSVQSSERSTLSTFPRSRSPAALPFTFSTDVPTLEPPPSLTSFLNEYSQTPFILPGFMAGFWPALNEHPWSSMSYLRSLAGVGRLVPVEIGHDYRDDDWTQTLMPWDDFLDALACSEENKGLAPTLYLAQHDLFKQFPALRDDIIVPDYVYASPPVPNDYPAYSPPGNEDQLVINTWLGPGGTVSPAHTDPFYNIYAQVVGRKTVWLAPPETTPYMYTYSSTSSDSEQPHNPAANNVNPTLSNTSQVDVFGPLEEIDGKFPRFMEHVIPRAMCATLNPGDLLFFPPGWWHAMRSEETSFSISMWF